MAARSRHRRDRRDARAPRPSCSPCPDWPGHVAGQHVDVRLTAADGYQTQRSYSIASAPEDATLALTVERLEDGEVSPYLTDELAPGDELELRGPVGGYFVWRADDGGPLLLVAGGSGLVPLMAMLRHRAAQLEHRRRATAVSARSLDDVLYRDELEAGRRRWARRASHAHPRATRRLGRLRAAGRRGHAQPCRPATVPRPRIFICGPTAFVERAADLLVGFGHDPPRSTPSDSVPPEDEMSERRAMAATATRWPVCLEALRRRAHRRAAQRASRAGRSAPSAPTACTAARVLVLRCPVCDQIALVAAALPDRHVVHLTGTWRMEMPRS